MLKRKKKFVLLLALITSLYAVHAIPQTTSPVTKINAEAAKTDTTTQCLRGGISLLYVYFIHIPDGYSAANAMGALLRKSS